MPCSDSQGLNYLEDHRTQRMMKEERELKKRIKQLESTDAQKALEEEKTNNVKLAERLNKTTELLCNATFILHEASGMGAIDPLPPHLQAWYDEHTEEDVARMKDELDNIVSRKNYSIRAFIKWYNGLNEKEQMLFESRSEFTKYKVNPK